MDRCSEGGQRSVGCPGHAAPCLIQSRRRGRVRKNGVLRWLVLGVCFSCFAAVFEAGAGPAGENSAGTGRSGDPAKKRSSQAGNGKEVTLRFSDFESGKPVAGFSFAGGCEEAPAAQQVTDKSGESRISCQPGARCRIWGGPGAEGHFLDSGYFYVLHCDIPIQLRPRKGWALRGTVRDPAGKPVVGAHLQWIDPAGAIETEVETGPGGHFVVFAKAPGGYSLVPVRGSGQEQRLMIAPTGKPGSAKREGVRPAAVEMKEKLQPLEFVLRTQGEAGLPAGEAQRSKAPGTAPPQSAPSD